MGKVKWVFIRPALCALHVALICLLFSPGHNRALAQVTQIPWEEPQFVTPDSRQLRAYPFLAADAEGRLHAIWHEGEDRGTAGGWYIEAIHYAYWDGTHWSTPVDVLAARPTADRGLSRVRGLTATPGGRLLVIRSEDGFVTISSAVTHDAWNPHAWSSQPLDAGVEPTLTVSKDGSTWCVAFWQDGATSLLLTCSSDAGATWDRPATVWSAPSHAAGHNVESLIALDGRVHLIWSEPTLSRDWNSEAIWHAVFDPRAQSVNVREVMRSESPEQPTLDGPAIAECPDRQMHLFWNNGIGSATGRFHQYSNPDGDTWSDVAPVFPGLSGQTSKAGLVCDSTGTVHLITAAPGPETTSAALRYATWREGVWSEYATLWAGRYPGERTRLVIARGNELHLVWDAVRRTPWTGWDSVAHSSWAIDAPPAPPLPQSPEATPTSVSAPEETDAAEAPAMTASVPAQRTLDLGDTTPADEGTLASAVRPVALSTSLVLGLLALVVMRARIRERG